ncbi:tRNA pseudouridine(38-40) synthase TruA [Paraconexibacter sp.]|uniref:tRNA pseudouridine(38-40) synthase TruA n=1 Tax=Paraconexibacter sp. TaxID=2949640 RepID=UPI00356404A0
MATSRMTIEYDGTAFHGWAVQPGLRTVQEELERALTVVARHPVHLTVAGRTDTGVHALGQVASYTGLPVRVASVNALLPPDVAVVSCEAAPDGFDARRDAISRRYRYRILTRRARSVFDARTSLHVVRDLDRDLLAACAAMLPGRHDFTAFTPTETDHVRFERVVHEARWTEEGDRLEFHITADAFMRHMNRCLVGTMLEIADRRRPLEGFARLLRGAHRREAGFTAPARGLTFLEARYPAARLG